MKDTGRHPVVVQKPGHTFGGWVIYRFLYYTEIDPVKIDPQPIKGYRWDCPCGVIGTRSESWSLVTKETSPCRIR